MKNKDKKDLYTKNIQELRKLLKECYDGLLSLRLQKEQNTLKNTSSLTLKRKEIAVILTILNLKKEVVVNG